MQKYMQQVKVDANITDQTCVVSIGIAFNS